MALQLRSVILINCGAVVDLTDIFKPASENEDDNGGDHSEPRQPLSVYVIDSHRPYDLNNVYNESQVFLLGHESAETLPRLDEIRTAFDSDDALSSDNDDDNDDEEEADDDDRGGDRVYNDGIIDTDDEADDDELGARRKRRRRAADDDDDALAQSSKRAKKLDGAALAAKKQRQQRRRASHLRKQAVREAAEDAYYRSCYYGSSVAMLLYPLAAELTRPTFDLLWYAAAEGSISLVLVCDYTHVS